MFAADLYFLPRPTALVQDILRSMIAAGDRVIDATAGNGHDTVFLAGRVGESGRVLAFDVQDAALRVARERVAAVGFSDCVDFIHGSHVGMGSYAEAGSVAAVMFNLGYLPGENHALTTESAETLVAMDAAAGLLRAGGVLSVICYPGHPSGAVEAVAVEEWMRGRAADGWRVARYGSLGTRKPAPFLLIARKSG